MASIGLEALCLVTHTMCMVGIWVASRICTDVALKLWFVYFWLREIFWLRTDIIVPANEKLNIMMLSNRADRSGQIVEVQISIQSLQSGCLLDTLLYSKTMLFKFYDNNSNGLGDLLRIFMVIKEDALIFTCLMFSNFHLKRFCIY